MRAHFAACRADCPAPSRERASATSSRWRARLPRSPHHPRAMATAAQEERVVNVYNWSDYVEPTVIEDFTKETGIKVRYDTFDSNETLETKLLAGKSGYDVVVPTAYFLAAPDQGRRVPEARQVEASEPRQRLAGDRARLAVYDPGNQYAVNYMWGTTGIGYNVNKAREILGAGRADRVAMASWDMVFKPEKLARFKDCGVHMLDSVRRYRRRGAALPRPRSELSDQADLEKAADAAYQDPAVRAQVPLLGISQRAGERRDLLRRRLVGRHQAGAEARGRGEGRRRHRLLDPEGGRAIVVRQLRHSRRMPRRGRSARPHRLYAQAGSGGEEHRTTSPTPTAISRARNSSTRRSSTIAPSTPTTPPWRGSTPSPRTTRRRSG